MSDKNRKYLYIGLAVAAVLLVVVAVVSFMSTGDAAIAGGAGAAAVAAAAAASKSRKTTGDAVDKAEGEMEARVEAVHDNADDAREEMARNEAAIAEMNTDEKVALGNDLLNPNKPDRSA